MKYTMLLASLFVYIAHTTHAMKIVPIKNEPSAETIQCIKGIQKRDSHYIEQSLLKGADVNYINEYGESLFYLACKTYNKNIILPFIDHPDINLMVRNQNHSTPLHLACKYDLSDTVNSMLSKNNKLATLRNEEGETPLIVASLHGHKKCCNALIHYNKEDSINLQNNTGLTALHYACGRKEYGAIRELIVHGANLTIKNNHQATPLILLYSHIDDINEWDSFITENDTIAKQFIQTVDQKNNNQFHLCTTLKNIVEPKFDNYLLFLASHQLNINARNDDGKRAVDLASEKYTELYNHYKTCKKCYYSKAIAKQEQVMHAFLRLTSSKTECALFTEVINNILTNDLLPSFACYYYGLNIETIVANKYKYDEKYYENYIKNKDEIKKQLMKNPEPGLLWNAQKTKNPTLELL